MSAQKTGTPAREKPSAMTCSVTVLPVPVAPVIRPWRLAYFSAQVFRARRGAEIDLVVDEHAQLLRRQRPL